MSPEQPNAEVRHLVGLVPDVFPKEKVAELKSIGGTTVLEIK
jgi:hypothetical protein